MEPTLRNLVDAVVALKPQPSLEYCFLWIDWWPMCMTKAEWSGWMQAVFSVLAIAAAASIAAFPHLRGRAQAEHVAGSFCVAVLHRIDSLEEVLPNAPVEVIALFRAVLQDDLEYGKAIRTELLTPKFEAEVRRLRSICAQLISYSAAVEVEWNDEAKRKYFSEVVATFKSGVEEACDELKVRPTSHVSVETSPAE